ncbi:germination protein, Ger(x)C family [Caloramator fervidus]|mgnify:CR=1 FL=1|uniref:Germination protein, Ger(X)C family n=1 Tax=Caloramator fervidus TaxID=29344 RepID=A0A1H5SS54_9CLOT|nr:germination protein, Ger(x)C family [Caloramator fervidus]
MRYLKKISYIVLFIFIFSSCYNKAPIERTSIISGVGHDLKSNKKLSSTFEFTVFKGQNIIDKMIVTTEGTSIFDMYNKRLLITKRKHLPGTIRLLLISENRAKYGISDIIDAFLRDQERNLNTTVAVSKQSTENILKMNPKDSNTMSEEIEDLIKSSFEANFTQNDVTIKDLFNMYYQEGRHIMIPYVEKFKDTIKLGGIAVFKDDKMIFVIPEEEAKYVNILRNDKAQGFLSFTSETSKSFDIACQSRRKIKVDYDDENIVYNINILIYASIKEANIDNSLELSKEKITELEEKYSKEISKKLQEISDKYKNNYQFDAFDIQKYAIAILGKDKQKYVEDNFKNSKINVQAKIKILSSGRIIR